MKDVIAQAELLKFYRHQTRLEDLKRQQKALQEDLDRWEEDFLTRLGAGAEVEHGKLLVAVDRHERRNVGWKQVVIDLRGEQYAEEVLGKTAPSVSYSVVVSKRTARLDKLRQPKR